MAADPEAIRFGRAVPGADRRDRPARAGKVRVLFATAGWPSGMLEVASWAKQEGLAEPVIFQIQPGYAFRLDEQDRQYLADGFVHPEIAESFARRGRPLSDDALVCRRGTHAWEICDAQHAWTYRVVQAADGLDVIVLENVQSKEFQAAIRRFAESKSLPEKFFQEDGSFTAAVHDALLAVGGQFIAKLIELEPHVVGFRLEGGDFEQVAKFVKTTRLFSDAAIVLGGPTATSCPAEVLRDSGADYVFCGEAEEPFNQFLRSAWERNSKDRQPEIPGLSYCYGNRIYWNTLPRDGYERSALETDFPSVGHQDAPPTGRLCAGARRCLRNLVRPVTETGVLAAGRLDWSLLEGFLRPFDSLYFTGGRGCPGACTFCAKLHGQQLRAKSARQLIDEIAAADQAVAAGRIRLTRWELFKHVDDPQWVRERVAWAAIYDEDFFLDRRRAIEFFEFWDRSHLKGRYRISLQTNPCSMLSSDGSVHPELLAWIDRLKPMVQLGAESFHPELLQRWRKRHNVEQLEAVLDALDSTGQDYTVFQLLTDLDTTPEEFVETLRLLVLNAYKHRRMRIASSPFTIPLYDSETRKQLEYRGCLSRWVRHFTDYERPQPGWMDPLVAELADLADAELQWTLNPEHRDAALCSAFEVVLEKIRKKEEELHHGPSATGGRKSRIGPLRQQAENGMARIRDARFQAVRTQGPRGHAQDQNNHSVSPSTAVRRKSDGG